MNRNLEDEYKDMILEEVPDLWDRIENALPEKTVENTDNVIRMDSNRRKKKNNINRIIVIAGGLAAACLVVAIGLPAFLLNNNSMRAESAACESLEADGGSEACEASYDGTEEEEMTDSFEKSDYVENSCSNDTRENEVQAMEEAEYDSLDGTKGMKVTATNSEENKALLTENMQEDSYPDSVSTEEVKLTTFTVVEVTADEEGIPIYHVEAEDGSQFSIGGDAPALNEGETYTYNLRFIEDGPYGIIYEIVQ